MTVSWPDSLPGIRWASVSYVPGSQVKRFETDDGGPAEQGRFTTAATDKLGFIMRCTASQKVTLLDFFNGDAQCGAVWFSYTDPIRERAALARFVQGSEIKITGASRNRFDCEVQLELRKAS